MEQEPKPILNYSSPAEEQQRAQAAEGERREAIKRYNESTFGERRPVASVFLRLALLFAVVAALTYFLPKWPALAVTLVLLVVFLSWEWRKAGWFPKRWDRLWYRWRL